MTLERFQEKTVEAAVKALTATGGSRRFLVADEVGLGKTVCAKAIAAELRRRRGGTLNVVYMCPNLDIASQNLTKLASLQEDWAAPEDRLSLVLRDRPSTARSEFRIYSYTPETSLPGWKPGQRTGRAAERALVAALLARAAPRTWRRLRFLDRHEETGEPRSFPTDLDEVPAHVRRPFDAALRELTGLAGRPLDAGLLEMLSGWREPVPEMILRCRAALALAALRHDASRPDLLILDEFHRYADLIMPADEVPADPHWADRHRVLRTLVEALIGDGKSGPALLLLSATPYRLQRLDKSEVAGGRYGQFVKLVRFLHGPNGRDEADRAEAAILAHRRALERRDDRASALEDVAGAKRALESALRPVIARTERATAISDELFERCDVDAPVEAGDLVTFRHLARAVSTTKGALRSWVQPLWSSVPYPAETLFDYNVCRALRSDLPSVTMASGGERPAHPQLRALVDPEGAKAPTISTRALALPWLAPTRPWWRLGGRWAELRADDRLRGKALIFSRYRGTPAAVAIWLSGEVERTATPRRGKGARKGKGFARVQSFLRPDPKSPWPLIALFMPFPQLSGAFEPTMGAGQSLEEVRRLARADLRAWLAGKEVAIALTEGVPRKPWRVAFDLEELLGGAEGVTASLRLVGALVRPRGWRPANKRPSVTGAEVDGLADWMLGAPGMIVARTLRRHHPDASVDAERSVEAFRFCWRLLRPYLGQRQFAPVVLGGRRKRGRGGYPEALRQALLDGGLEATLDEHVAVTRLVGQGDALAALRHAVVGRPGRVRRRTTRGVKSARVHAATPYLGAERKADRGGPSEKLRSDTLRKAFNSPFWPHVLATTSIGQEGLDFHVWCDRVIHWDLPRDPVDFEQREGRVARYGSLGVRRALADKHADVMVPAWRSPFQAIFDAARAAPREGLGLERWWSPVGHRPVSVTFSMPFSLGGLRLQRLREELVEYRLALGQPDPLLFEGMIQYFDLGREEARRLALNLSPTHGDDDATGV